MARNESIWCPSGGDWYACSTGTYFAGCCAVNPCSITCPVQDLYPVLFDGALFGTFPDMSCDSGSDFYICGRSSHNASFFGCCKSNACVNAACPVGDLTPAFIKRPEQIELFGDPSVNNMGVSPVTTSSVVLALEPAMASTSVYNGPGFGRSDAIISASISVAVMVALCASVALWLGWRKSYIRRRHAYVSIEQ
jgi:hypothetical protein